MLGGSARPRALLLATAAALLPALALAFAPSHAPALRSGVSSLRCAVRGTDSASDAHPAASFRRAGAPFVGLVGAAIALMSPLAAVSDVAVVAPVPVFRMAAVTLPDDWSTAVTEDGKEYYFNLKTKQSQWAPPTGAQVEKATKKKKNQQNNLNEVIRFDSQPTVVIDRITINEPVPLPEGCGEADFRSNSLECGQPAKPLPIDVAEKTYGALSVVNNKEGSKSKAEAADARYRMLQDAEMKALSKTALFKKLDGQTQDPERKRLRAEEVRTITDQNDAGSRLAPWAREDDPYPPARIEYPKFEIPSWVPFIGSKEVKEAVEVAVDAEAVVAE